MSAPSSHAEQAASVKALAERFGLHTATGVLGGAEIVDVHPALQGLLPHGGLRRGAVLGLSGPLGWSLAFALIAEATRQGHWCAVIGDADLGLPAPARLGVDFSRLAQITVPGGSWLQAAGILLESADLLLIAPDFRPTPKEQQRLLARIRERRAVVLLFDDWPGTAHLGIVARRWEGLGQGSGRLRRCLAQLSTPLGARMLWLPDADGGVAAAEEPLLDPLAARRSRRG